MAGTEVVHREEDAGARLDLLDEGETGLRAGVDLAFVLVADGEALGDGALAAGDGGDVDPAALRRALACDEEELAQALGC